MADLFSVSESSRMVQGCTVQVMHTASECVQ